MTIKKLLKELKKYKTNLKIEIHDTSLNKNLKIKSILNHGTHKIGYTVMIYC